MGGDLTVSVGPSEMGWKPLQEVTEKACFSLPLHPARTQQEGSCLPTRKRLSAEASPAGHPDLGLPACSL